ncbi:MAG: family 10 glycosylhydrolase [Ignavibacterium sp.]|nr:family 10 glycosylhydrolase [Ignavibacterium sp.]MCX7611991.1 family 10 glycosylhydrolase [Ignavibacterium sp.]MDW8375133.1 family 10 glycosylhydrolase [Ignavibacteriales bacterium]
MNKVLFLLMILSLSCYTFQQNDNEAVRGVWLTNVDSEVLNSKQSIIEAVNLLDELGFNTIFVVVWNKAMTTYPSKIMKELTGVEIDTTFSHFDPLKELIEVAHSKNIKVIAWFEFGFSSSYKLDGGPILKAKPHWAAKDVKGNLVTKNGFEWMNGFHPEVQQFMISLIMEVVRNYDIDGIQGDDRLPAMPSEAGYDEFTIELYKKQHQGQNPPEYHKDYYWIKWRSGLLTNFMKTIYDSVKNYNKNLIVSMAPSIYPWSEEEYLQDWPTWVRKGYVDLICPQVYRYNIKDYQKALKEIVKDQISKQDLTKLYPGVLLKVGNYYPSEEYLDQMIQENRRYGINGEVFFFYEGIKKFQNFFRKIYREKAKFPQLID